MARERIPPGLREAVAERAGGCCEYCRSQVRFATQAFSVEHVIPHSLGGTTAFDNLALACQGCNNHKYIKVEGEDPAGRGTVRLFHPRRDTWTDHFVWSEDYSIIVGITPIGRATVAALQLNRPGLVNLRRVLFEAGEHPR